MDMCCLSHNRSIICKDIHSSLLFSSGKLSFWDRLLGSLGRPWTHYVTGAKFLIFLLPTAKSWEYRQVPLCLDPRMHRVVSATVRGPITKSTSYIFHFIQLLPHFMPIIPSFWEDHTNVSTLWSLTSLTEKNTFEPHSYNCGDTISNSHWRWTTRSANMFFNSSALDLVTPHCSEMWIIWSWGTPAWPFMMPQ